VDELGVEVVQLFVANPRAWREPPDAATADDAFRVSCTERAVPVFVHAPYLINFGSPAEETLRRSATALAFSLRRGAAIGARGVVIHAGSAIRPGERELALKRAREHLLPVLDAAATGSPRLLIEPTAGGGGALASDATSLAELLDVLERDERIGVCLDTCHMHAAGHDLSGVTSFRAALKAYGAAAGRGAIELIHANDSRDPVNSKRDRHAVIGAGTIGHEPFAALFTSPVTRGVPMVVESPPEDHPAQLATLRQLRGAL
jgi:deoxyribonuclease-4